MKKSSLKGYLIIAIILIVFSVVAFLPPFSKTAVFFVAYCFGLISILSQIYFFKTSFSCEGAKSKFYGFPIARLGVIYLVVQLILSLLEMVFAAVVPLWVVLIVDIVVTGAAAIGCIAVDTMREEIVRQDNVLKKDVSAMRELQSLAAVLQSQCDNDEMKEDIKKISEELRFSDPVSSEKSAILEKRLLVQLGEIQNAMLAGDAETVKEMSEKALANLTERNRICKLSK
ncbi:MAG: hypothetical protein LUH08_02645 [Ruminococcus sp.]|nr:hypothetical protein [Ruminococcus sp.]